MNNVVFVDICNTLANVNEQLIKRGYHTDLYPCDVPNNIWEDEQIFKNATPIQPVIYFVQRLSQVSDVMYLTARPQSLKDVTVSWLERYALPIAPIIHTNGKLKGEVIKNINDQVSSYPIILEDSPIEIESIISEVPNAFIFIPDWNYNKHIVGNRIQH